MRSFSIKGFSRWLLTVLLIVPVFSQGSGSRPRALANASALASPRCRRQDSRLTVSRRDLSRSCRSPLRRTAIWTLPNNQPCSALGSHPLILHFDSLSSTSAIRPANFRSRFAGTWWLARPNSTRSFRAMRPRMAEERRVVIWPDHSTLHTRHHLSWCCLPHSYNHLFSQECRPPMNPEGKFLRSAPKSHTAVCGRAARKRNSKSCMRLGISAKRYERWKEKDRYSELFFLRKRWRQTAQHCIPEYVAHSKRFPHKGRRR